MKPEPKLKTRSVEDLGFSPEQIAGLVNQAQSIHAPDPFDEEVHRHLQTLGVTEQDDFGQRQIDQAERIANLSVPENPSIPAPKQPLPVDGRKSLEAKFQAWDPNSDQK